MANNYWTHLSPFIANSKVKSSEMNPKLDGISTAFDLLPVAADSIKLGKPTFVTETGSGNSYVVDFTGTDIRTVNSVGDEVVFVATHTNTGTPTLNVNGIGPVQMTSITGVTLIANDITLNLLYNVRFNGSTFQMIGASLSELGGSSAARDWAITVRDTPVPIVSGGNGSDEYSSLHWADGAKDWATLAEDSLIPTEVGGNGSSDYSALHWSAKTQAAKGFSEEWANKAHGLLISTAAGGDFLNDYSALHWSVEATNTVVDKIDKDGSVAMAAALRHPDGTLLLPSVTFTNELSSGMWSHASYLGFSYLGGLKLGLDAAGVDVTGTLNVTGATTIASGGINVTGNSAITGTLNVSSSVSIASGTLIGNVTGHVSGTAASVTDAAQPNITSLGTLTSLQVDSVNINGSTIQNTAGSMLIEGITFSGANISGVGTISATTFSGPLSGNSDTATAWATGRTISLTGDATGTSAAWTGSGPISIPVVIGSDNHTHTGATISSLSGSDITSGTVADAYLPATISSNITGNAATATTAGTTNTISVGSSSTNSAYSVLFASARSGSVSPLVDNLSTSFTYNPSLNTLVVSGDITKSSDERLKNNIVPIDNPLIKLAMIRGVEYDRIDTGIHQSGVIAQEVRKAIPSAVYEDEEEMLSVSDSQITGLLVAAINELAGKVNDLTK